MNKLSRFMIYFLILSFLSILGCRDMEIERKTHRNGTISNDYSLTLNNLSPIEKLLKKYSLCATDRGDELRTQMAIKMIDWSNDENN